MRAYGRYREGSHFWEDTNNNARSAAFGAYRRLRVISATVSLTALCLFAQTLEGEARWAACAVALVRWSEEIGSFSAVALSGPRVAIAAGLAIGGPAGGPA